MSASVEDLESHILEKYNIIQRLGKGAYGVVWRAINKETKEEVAIKKVFDAFSNPTDAQRTFREVMFLRQLSSHENVVRFHTMIRAQSPNDIYLVFEFIEIDLHHVIRGNILEEVHKQYVVYQILKALKYIHSANIIHRDLKPSNILLNTDCLVKVADFGLARTINDEDDGAPQILTEYIATRWYRAPEIVLGSQTYSKAIDVWSVGCILAEMVTGKAPFPGKSTINQIELIIELLGRPTKEDLESLDSNLAFNLMENIKIDKQKSFTQTFAKASPLAIDLLRKLLTFNPKKRISIQEALEHPYLADFHFPEEETTFASKIYIPISDDKKLSRHDYRKALHKMIEEKEAEEKRALRKSQSRPLSGSKEDRESDGKFLQQKSTLETVSKYLNYANASQLKPREPRQSSKSKERTNTSFAEHASQLEHHLKKSLGGTGDSAHVLFEVQRKASREQYRSGASADPAERPLAHINLYQQDAKAAKPEPRTAAHAKKLLNGSGERQNPLRVSDEKDSKAKLANKENYFQKYLRQGSDLAHSREYDHAPANGKGLQQAPNCSLENPKPSFARYEVKAGAKANNSSLGSNSAFTPAPDKDPKGSYNMIGSRILKKLKKNSSGPGLNPEQILRSGAVYDNKYLYHAILNNSKSRPKLGGNPFKNNE